MRFFTARLGQAHLCFWHKHDCGRFVWPATNAEYWHKKIEGNVSRDKENIEKLKDMGWRIYIIWECQLKKQSAEENLEKLYLFIINKKEA